MRLYLSLSDLETRNWEAPQESCAGRREGWNLVPEGDLPPGDNFSGHLERKIRARFWCSPLVFPLESWRPLRLWEGHWTSLSLFLMWPYWLSLLYLLFLLIWLLVGLLRVWLTWLSSALIGAPPNSSSTPTIHLYAQTRILTRDALRHREGVKDGRRGDF